MCQLFKHSSAEILGCVFFTSSGALSFFAGSLFKVKFVCLIRHCQEEAGARYEKAAYQEKVAGLYAEIGANDPHWTVIDGTRSIEVRDRACVPGAERL